MSHGLMMEYRVCKRSDAGWRDVRRASYWIRRRRPTDGVTTVEESQRIPLWTNRYSAGITSLEEIGCVSLDV